MSLLTPLMTGILRRRRERFDNEKLYDFELDKLSIQEESDQIQNEQDNMTKVNTKIIELYNDKSEGKITHGGSDAFTALIKKFENGSYDNKVVDTSELDTSFAFQFSKPDKNNPIQFLSELESVITRDKDKFLEYYTKNPNDFDDLLSAFDESIKNYDLKARTVNEGGSLVVRPNIAKQYPSIASVEEFKNSLNVFYGEDNSRIIRNAEKIGATDVVTSEIDIEGISNEIVEPTSFSPSIIGLPDTNEGYDKLNTVYNYLKNNNPDMDAMLDEQRFRNEFLKKGSDTNEYGKALAIALPFGQKLNSYDNLDTKKLHMYVSGKPVQLEDGNMYQTDFFTENEGRVADLFLFMSPKRKTTDMGSNFGEKFTPDDKVISEAEQRKAAADRAIDLANDYINILNVSEGYGLPDNSFIRSYIGSFEGIRKGLTSTLQYLRENNIQTNQEFITNSLTQLESFENQINNSLTTGIKDSDRATIIKGLQNFTETALAYQVSMAFQGGSGGRTVSNEDFQLVKAAIGSTLTDTYTSQKYKLNALKKFLEAPQVTSELVINHGIQGYEAAKLFDKYYNSKTSINLNSINNEAREVGPSEFANVLGMEMMLSPKDGAFNQTVITPEFNPTNDLRSRVMIVDVPEVGNVAVMQLYKGGRQEFKTIDENRIKTIIVNTDPDFISNENIPVFVNYDGNYSYANLYRQNDPDSMKRKTTVDRILKDADNRRKNLTDADRLKIESFVKGPGMRIQFAPANMPFGSQVIKDTPWFQQ